MLLSGRPLRSTMRDQSQFFVGREDLVAALSANITQFELNVLVHGTRGSGRTSLLHAIEMRIRTNAEQQNRPGVEVTYLDCSGLDATSTVERLRERIVGPRYELIDDDRNHAFKPQSLLSPYPRRREARWTDTGQILDYLEVIGQRVGSHPTPHVVILDDISTNAARVLFGRLRDEVWNLSITWLVSTTTTRAPAVLEPPADAFFETVRELPPLAPAAAATLIERRLDPAEPQLNRATIASIVNLSNGHPRTLVGLTRTAVIDGPEAIDDRVGAHADADTALNRLSGPARELVETMSGLGAVSASDDQLQASLGWSRSRISQVFAELRAAGLVTTAPGAHEDGQNRRRKLYVLAPAVGGDDQ